MQLSFNISTCKVCRPYLSEALAINNIQVMLGW